MKAERTHKFKFWARGEVTLKAMALLAMAIGAGPARAETVSNSYATFTGDRVGVMADGDFYYDVDGEGEMVVTAADGWLVNGSESVTVYRDRNRGQCLGFQSKLGEGSEGCHVFPHSVLGDVHKAGEAVSISAWTPSAAYTAVYAAPDDVAKVAAPVYSKVEKKGLHVETREWKRPCSCGTYPTFETDVREYEVVPDVFVKRVRVGREASSRDVSEGRVSLLKGENQHLEYTVAASRKASPECALCAATASAEALADVYELSVSMESEYLGLDMTDTARGHQVSRTATARIDPNPKSGNHAVYRWTDCGTRCEWSSSLSASTVKYRTDGSKGPSSRYREEPLVVEGTVYTQNWLGPKVSAACTNRFTIVKVDVVVNGKSESKEETEGCLVQYAKDPVDDNDVNVLEEWTNRLVAVDFAVAPLLPRTERICIRCPHDSLYVKSNTGYSPADVDYAVSDLCSTNFYLHGHRHGTDEAFEHVSIIHEKSGAIDEAAFSCFLLDLDVDSDNDLEIEVDDDFEDKIENLWPGKILAVDGHGISDGVDYVARMRMMLEGNLTGRGCKIRLVASDRLRLYADEDRKSAIATESLVDSGVIVPQKSVFLDGVKEGRGFARLELIDGGGNVVGSDEVKVLVIPTVARAPGRSRYAAMWAPTDMMDGIAIMEDYLKEVGFKDIVWYTPGFWGGAGSCTYDNFKEMANNGVIGISSHGDVDQYPAVYFNNSANGCKEALDWVTGEDRKLPGSWICPRLTGDGEKIAVWVYQPWFEKYWKPQLDQFDAIVAWETCFSSSYLDYCGGRVALGFESGTTGAWAKEIWKNIFGRMDGRIAAGSARKMKTAFGAAAGQWKSDRGTGDIIKLSDLVLKGNVYTTLCPAPLQKDAFFPQQCLPNNSDAFGCVIFDTYLSPCHDASRVIAVAGAGARDFVWLRQSHEEPPYGVGFKIKKRAGRANATCYGEQVLNDGSLGGRYSDLDLVGPNGHNKEWEF